MYRTQPGHDPSRGRWRLGPRPVALLALVVLIAIALLSSNQPAQSQGAGAGSGTSGTTGGTTGGSAQSLPPPGPGFQDPLSQQVTRQETQAAQRETERRKSPAAKDARKASKKKFRDKSAAQARAIGKEHFKDVVGAPVATPLAGSSPEVERYLGDHAAVVEAGDGKRGIVQSALALRPLDGPGRNAPVDLSLRESGDAFAPANPLAALRIPKELAEPVSFGGESLRFRVEGAAGSGTRVGDQVFFGNVGTDTDLLLSPAPLGVETFLQLRSEDSPEQIVLDFELLAGVRLEKARTGAVEIVRGEESIGLVMPPTAADAEGWQLPLSLSIAGDRVIIGVEHRAGDWAYPILVDPLLADGRILNDYLYWTNKATTSSPTGHPYDAGLGFQNWTIEEKPGLAAGHFYYLAGTSTYHPQDLSGYGRGLYVQGNEFATHANLDYGEYVWRSPGDTYIYRADMGYAVHDQAYTSSSNLPTSIKEGLWSPQLDNWEYGHFQTPSWDPNYGPTCKSWANPPPWNAGDACATGGRAYWSTNSGFRWWHRTFCTAPACAASGGTPGNLAAFALVINGSGTLYPDPAQVFLGGAGIYYTDNNPPYVRQTIADGVPSDWANEGTMNVGADFIDDGVGNYKATLSTPDANGTISTDTRIVPNCTGDVISPCPATWWNATWIWTWPLDVATLGEGIGTIRMHMEDVLGRGTSPTGDPAVPTSDRRWTVKVDRTPPTLALSGPLYDRRGQQLGPDATYALHADARDGRRDAGPSAERSGVRTVEISVDGERVDFDEQECDAGSCALTRDWTFDPRDFRGGEHTIRVTASDQLGQETVTEFKAKTACCLTPAAGWGTLDALGDFLLADVSGDGLTDLVGRSTLTGEVKVGISDGTRFAPPAVWGQLLVLSEAYAADADGDGLADLVSRDKLTGEVRVGRSDGSRFGTAAVWGVLPTNQDLYLADVDQGDGADLVGRNRDTGELRVGYSTRSSFEASVAWGSTVPSDQVQIADTDDDDMADLVVRRSTGDVSVGLSTQEGFGAPATWGRWDRSDPLRAVDANGDNMAELLSVDPSTGDVSVSVSDGLAFRAPENWGRLDPLLKEFRVGDVDGDGDGDVVARHSVTGAVEVAQSYPLSPTLPSSPAFVADPGDVYDDALEFTDDATGGTRQAEACVGVTTAARATKLRLAAQDDGVLLRDPAGAEAEQAWRRLRQAGVTIVRFNAYWGHIEASARDANGNPRYNLSQLEAAVRTAKCKGFDVYITITGAAIRRLDCSYELWPESDRSLGCRNDVPGTDDNEELAVTGNAPAPADYARFVSAVVNRFSRSDGDPAVRVDVYGLWNEPNGRGFLQSGRRQGDGPRVAALYRELYRQGRDAGRAASGNATRFNLGELSENPRGATHMVEFLRRIASAGTRTTVDGVAIHPYQHRKNPSEGFERRRYGMGRLSDVARAVRDLSREDRLVAPRGIPRLYLTEFGYWNRKLRPDSSIATVHTEGERADWLDGALDEANKLARKGQLRWMTFYNATEKTPDIAQCQSVPRRYSVRNVWDMGLFGVGGEITGTRCYGRNRSGSRQLTQTQERRAYCSIWAWARRKDRLSGVEYPVDGNAGCPLPRAQS